MLNNFPVLVFWTLIPLLASANTIAVRGTTVNGMAFGGILSGTAGGILNLSPAMAGHPVLGIPVAEIAVLSAPAAVGPEWEIAGLFDYPEALHLWDDLTKERLVRYVEDQMVGEQWVEGYQNASMLNGITSNIALTDRIQLARAWSLYEMGLSEQSQSVLDEMEARRGPEDYSTRYCWLRAKIARIARQIESAAYWSLLPLLRIPSDTSELATGLAREQQEWGIQR